MVEGDVALVGPNLSQVYNNSRNFVDGTSAEGDADYILQSIINPASQVVEGYQPVMPGNYGTQLSEEQLNALVAYIQSLAD